MDSYIWMQCQGLKHVCSFQETAWRMVEAQHILATRKLVDSIAEHELLEEMIDVTKPKPFGKEFLGLHFLLYTPFCYPPLKFGSRFGKKNERSLWYGSLQLSTVLAEKAYYQFIFLQGTNAELGMIERTFSSFSVPIKTQQGINLTQTPFDQHVKVISSPELYEQSQLLGTAMRQAKIEAFYYQSARDPNCGINLALFTPRAFLNKIPNANSFQTWKGIADKHSVEFMRTSSLKTEKISFSIEIFRINKKLPVPA